MEAKSLLYEGFISCRHDNVDIAEELATELGRLGVTCAWQGTIADDTADDHVAQAVMYIEMTMFSVILVGPGFHEPAADGGKNRQSTEILRIISKSAEAGRSDESAATYASVVVFLSKDHENSNTWFVRELDKLRKRDAAAAALYAQLKNFPIWMQIYDYLDKESHSRQDSIIDTAQAIRKRVRKLREAIAAQEKKARPDGAGAPRLQDIFVDASKENVKEEAEAAAASDPMQLLLAAYVEKAAAVWRQGLVTNIAPVKGARRPADADSEFAFNSSRFMQLDGEEAFTTQMASGADLPRQPMSNWLLTKQRGILNLSGDAGAGKSTVVAAAALAYASHWRPKYKPLASQYSEGAWLEAAQRLLSGGPQFLPVCISVPRLVAHLADPDTCSGDELNTAIVDCLRETVKGSKANYADLTGEDFVRFIERQPVVLFLDGLDEVSRDAAQGICSAASALYWQFQDEERDQFRMIITSRPGVNERSRDDVHVRLLGPDWQRIEEFIRRYVSAQDDQERSQEKHALLLTEASDLFRSMQESRSRLVRRPMLLKLFCWHFWNNGAFIRQIEFCEIVISHLTKDRNFETLQSRLADGEADADAAAAAARKLLGWLALRTFEKKVDKKKSGETNLQATKDELLKRHAEFGLARITASCADKIIRELAAQTNLLAIANQNISFREHLLFCEFLISEAIRDRDPVELIESIGPEHAANWSNALTFAEHAARAKQTEGGGDVWPYSNALLVHAERLAAQGREDDAVRLLEIAVNVLGENQSPESPDVPQEVRTAIHVYRGIARTLDSKRRDAMIHDLVRLGARDNAGAQRRAVQTVFDVLLHPRRHWVDLKAPGLPEAYRLGDAPVHVAAYRMFCEAEDCLDPDFWQHLPDDPELESRSGEVLGTPDCDDKGTVIWAAQMRKPGGPVVGANWFEAVAYCHWLTRRLRLEGILPDDEIIRLPTVSEWMAVSRLCASGRKYTFGDVINDEAANTGFLRLDGVSPAGVFPPFGPGLYDFGTNVRCWTTRDADRNAAPGTAPWPPRPPRSSEGTLFTDDKPQVGGGSWACTQVGLFDPTLRPRTLDPFTRSRMVGFRLARVPAGDT